jgi:hypothetical protein
MECGVCGILGQVVEASDGGSGWMDGWMDDGGGKMEVRLSGFGSGLVRVCYAMRCDAARLEMYLPIERRDG